MSGKRRRVGAGVGVVVSSRLLKVLGFVLDADEIGLYLAAKALLFEAKKMPSASALDRLIPKSLLIASKMRKKKLIPKGRLDLSHIDEQIRIAQKEQRSVRPVRIEHDLIAIRPRYSCSHCLRKSRFNRRKLGLRFS